MTSPSPPADAAAAAASPPLPPSFGDVEAFLLALLNWLYEAGGRLTCTAQSNALHTTRQQLTAVNARRHGAASTWMEGSASGSSGGGGPQLMDDALGRDDSAAAADTAVLSMQLSVVRSLLVLGGLWYAVVRLLAWSLPGLQVRGRSARLHAWLRRTEAVIGRDAARVKATSALRRRTNMHQLVTAGVCTAAAACCILLLLTAHIWTGLVMWQLWDSVVAPVAQAWSWASASWHPTESADVARDAHQRWLTPLHALVDTPALQMLRGLPHLLWQLTGQLQVMYVWHLLGSAVLGLSLWLLSFAHQRMRTFDASVALVTSRSSEPPLLHRLKETEERRRDRQALLLQQATLRQTQRLVERVGEEGGGELLRLAQQQSPVVPAPLREAAVDDAGAAAAAAAESGGESKAAATEHSSACGVKSTSPRGAADGHASTATRHQKGETYACATAVDDVGAAHEKAEKSAAGV